MKHLALLAALVCAAAHADFKDGNKLYHQITSGNGSDYVNAVGYVTGVADAMRGSVHCMPDNATAGQILDMTKLTMDQKPQLRHHSAYLIITATLMDAWPCPTKGKPL